MAAYTSTGTGDFTNVATWGGGGYPSLAGDTFTVTAGHTVSIDLYSLVELGASTINGTLVAKAGGVRRLLFAHVDLTIGATGNLGNAATVANGDAFILEWNTTSDNAKGLSITAGGQFKMVGDPAFYGSSDNTTIATQWSGAGRIVTVTGDYTTKWAGEILGPELITNGTFDDATWGGADPNKTVTGWSKYGTYDATNFITNTGYPNQCLLSYAGSSKGISQTILTVGKIYKCTFDVASYTSGTIYVDGGGASLYSTNSSGSKVVYFTAITAIFYIYANNPTTAVIDNVSVKEVLSGREIFLHRGQAYSSYLTDTLRASIHSMALNGGNTDITIGEAAPAATFNAGAIVINPCKNVILGKLNADKRIGQYNTNRPRISDNNTVSGNVVCSDIQSVGLERGITSNSIYTNLCARNASNSCFLTYNAVVSGIFFSFGTVVFNAMWKSTINSNCFCNVVVSAYVDYVNFLGNYFSCQNGFTSTSRNCEITGQIFGIQSATVGSMCVFKNSKIGLFNNLLSLNSQDIGFLYNSGYTEINAILLNCSIGNATISTSNRNSAIKYNGKYKFEHYNQTLNDHRKLDAYADVFRDATIIRTGGASTSIKATPLSNCSTTNPVQILGLWQEGSVPVGAFTRSVKILGTGWGVTFPLVAELYLEAEYYTGTGNATTTAVSTAVLTDNTTWFDFPVTFTQGVLGKVTYKLYIKKYVASAYISVDAALYRVGRLPVPATWSEGEAHVMCDSSSTGVFGGSASISGVIKDYKGQVIDCSVFPVRVNVYLKGNSLDTPLATALVSASSGGWSISTLESGQKYLVTFEYEGSYLPQAQTDIAGAEFLTAS